jgi:hypothetical protein
MVYGRGCCGRIGSSTLPLSLPNGHAPGSMSSRTTELRERTSSYDNEVTDWRVGNPAYSARGARVEGAELCPLRRRQQELMWLRPADLGRVLGGPGKPEDVLTHNRLDEVGIEPGLGRAPPIGPVRPRPGGRPRRPSHRGRPWSGRQGCTRPCGDAPRRARRAAAGAPGAPPCPPTIRWVSEVR